MSTIWVVDDDPAILAKLRSILTAEGYSVAAADSAEEFLSLAPSDPPAVTILDIFFGPGRMDGEELLKIIAERYPNAQTLMMSGESDIQKTLACLRQGALDFLEKPVSLPRLLTSVRNAQAIFNTRNSTQGQSLILGESPAIRRTKDLIHKLAKLNETVLILGESGTGKELVATNLHLFSPRYALPMQRVNCAALNPNLIEAELFGHKKGSFTGATRDHVGYFEAAHGSSLFIDEIGDFEPHLQGRILRVLQERTVARVGDTREISIDVRFVFATHRNLGEMAAQGNFREDLYFRLSTFVVEVPPLRERLEDIDLLAPHFLQLFLAENNLAYKVLTSEALARLKEYDYPGNVRELAKVVKNAAFFSPGELVTADAVEFLSPARRADIWAECRRLSLTDGRRLLERELVAQRLREMSYDIGLTAESLGILRPNLYRKLRELDLDWQKPR
jgi:two-component system, NtrC family, nitrogen regulation response regulator NtrX